MSAHVIPLLDSARNFDAGEESFSSQHGPNFPGNPAWSVVKTRLKGGRSDGVDVVTLSHDQFSVDVLPTRGMGLWRGESQGQRLGWDSPVRQPVHPGFVNLESRGQLGWLDGFNEWLCRCGLAFNGPPGADEDGTPITLHGRIANLPAHDVRLILDTEESQSLILEGVVDETSMFGTSLRLTSRVILPLGRPVLRIVDEVTNLGSKPQEYELLYHINQGEPFLGDDSVVTTPFREMAPRDARGAEGIETWDKFDPPLSGYAEQVYFFEPVSDAAGWGRVVLKNPAAGCALSVRFTTSTLPYLAVWKNTQAKEDGYCTGLEPGTDFPNHRAFERKQQRLRMLAPGATERLELEIEVACRSETIADWDREIARLQSHAGAIIHSTPHARMSPC